MLVAFNGLIIRDDDPVPPDSIQVEDRLADLQLTPLGVNAPQLRELVAVQRKDRLKHHTVIGKKFSISVSQVRVSRRIKGATIKIGRNGGSVLESSGNLPDSIHQARKVRI